MKYNYQLLIEYDGTKFVGWQIQKNGLSVQEKIEKTIKRLIKKKIILVGSGRTDAGVHALEQSANFKTDYIIEDKNSFIKSLNFFLFKDGISILDLKKKKFHFILDIVQKKEAISTSLLIEKHLRY